MIKNFVSATALFLLVFSSSNAYAQCKSFAKKVSKTTLESYTHDGNFHAAILSAGEEAELYKTFYSNQEYRLVVNGASNLPPIEFIILDVNKNVLYSNKNENYAKSWDFKLQTSQKLKLVVKVLSANKSTVPIESGCVAILFGLKVD